MALRGDPSASISDLIEDAVIDQTRSSDPGIVTVAKRCVTVYKWQLQAVAWVAIFYAATISIVGLFATSTIAGAPAGVVLGALGIGLGASGSFVLWVVDKIKWNSKRICW